MKETLNIFKQPYPFSFDYHDQIRNVIFIAIFPVLFFLSFKPFGLGKDGDWLIYLAIFGFGIVSGLCAAFFWLLIPGLFKKYFSGLSIGNAILYNLLFLLVLAVLNFIYKSFLENFEDLSWYNFFLILYRTLLIATIPLIIIIIFRYNFLLRSNLRSAKEINEILIKDDKSEVTLRSENGKELIRFKTDQLLYVENADNYIWIYIKNHDKIDRKMIRNTMNYVIDEISKPFILRCHRSFIINLKKVTLAKGNSRGLQLELGSSDRKIPVSRKYVKEITNGLRAF